jgi:hypothetical protein
MCRNLLRFTLKLKTELFYKRKNTLYQKEQDHNSSYKVALEPTANIDFE